MNSNLKKSNPILLNKNRKIAINLFCLCILIITGCNKYQFITISSPLYKNSENKFELEDDTLKLTYIFRGKDFPMKLAIQNKLDKPIFFDASNSFVLMNNSRITEAFESYGQSYRIFAKSTDTIVSNPLSDKLIPLNPDDSITNEVIPIGREFKRVKMHSFTEETSPVYLTSILYFATNPSLSESFYYEHPFWISKIYQTYDIEPNYLHANQFSMQKTTDFSHTMGCAGYTVLIGALLIIMAEVEPATIED